MDWEKSGTTIGGCLIVGLGAGFFMLPTLGGLAFAACIMSGLGIGLVLAPMIG